MLGQKKSQNDVNFPAETLCYNVYLECVYHVCVYVYVRFSAFCSLSPSFEHASFLDCVRFCMVKKSPPPIKMLFIFGYSIDFYGQVKLTHERHFCYYFLFVLLHPHKIIESTQFLCVCYVLKCDTIQLKNSSFFINSIIFQVRVKLTREGHFCYFFFKHPLKLFESTQIKIVYSRCKCDKSQEVSYHYDQCSIFENLFRVKMT